VLVWRCGNLKASKIIKIHDEKALSEIILAYAFNKAYYHIFLILYGRQRRVQIAKRLIEPRSGVSWSEMIFFSFTNLMNINVLVMK